MDDSSRVFAPELSPTGSRRWIGRLVLAILLGAAIWNFVVSLTVNVVVPGLARVMEADPQSPLYLGKGDINVAALFISLLELCFAVIAALLVNSWSERKPRPVRKKSVSVAPMIAVSAAATAPIAQPRIPVPAPAPPEPQAARPQQQATPSPKVAETPAPLAKAEKPAKPKRVYYNSVGDPIEYDDE